MPSVTGIIIADAVRRYMKRHKKNPHSPLTKLDETICWLLVNHKTWDHEQEAIFHQRNEVKRFKNASEVQCRCWRHLVCLSIAMENHFGGEKYNA